MARSKTSHLRGRQLTTGGHGSFFASPIRKNYRKKSGYKIFVLDSSDKYLGLHARLQQLRNSVEHPSLREDIEATSEGDSRDDLGYQDNVEDMDYVDEGLQTEPVSNPQTLPCPLTPEHEKRKRRILPNTADFNEYRHWQTNVGQLVDAYLLYINKTLGKPTEHIDVIRRKECECDVFKESLLTCLYFDRACTSLF